MCYFALFLSYAEVGLGTELVFVEHISISEFFFHGILTGFIVSATSGPAFFLLTTVILVLLVPYAQSKILPCNLSFVLVCMCWSAYALINSIGPYVYMAFVFMFIGIAEQDYTISIFFCCLSKAW